MIQIKKYSLKELSMMVLLGANSSLWFFESVLNMHILVVVMNLLALFLLFLVGEHCIQKNTTVLLGYVLGILISVVFNGATTRVLYRIVLIGLTVLYGIFFVYHPKSFESGKKCLIFFGLLMAVTVVLQFVLKDAFSTPFYRLISEEDRKEVLFYYNRGYYPGLNVKPHETAGLLAIAMGALIIDRWNSWKKVLPAVLLIPMLLSGKRAITVLSVAAILALYLLELVVTGRGVKFLRVCFSVVIVAAIALTVMMLNLDSPLFARFATLFNKESGSSFIDSTRLRLWNDAFILWKENVLFGVGWWSFNDLSITRFHYARSHAVNLDYLQWLCETGIVGFILMMCPVIVIFRRGLKMGIRAARGKLRFGQKEHIYFALYIQIFILVYALIEVPFYNNFFFTVYVYSAIVINTYYSRYKKLSTEAKDSLGENRGA